MRDARVNGIVNSALTCVDSNGVDADESTIFVDPHQSTSSTDSDRGIADGGIER